MIVFLLHLKNFYIKMKAFASYSSIAILFILLFTTVANAQQSSISGDTTKLNLPASKSPFGLLEVPTDLMNTDFEGKQKMTLPSKFSRFELYSKDYAEDLKKYGLARPDINLHLNYYNPEKSLHPALYALLLVGAFFNNTVSNVPDAQYHKIMNDLYGYSPYSSSSRYSVAQFNITKGVFGRPDIVVSGYTSSKPEFSQYNNILPVNNKANNSNKP